MEMRHLEIHSESLDAINPTRSAIPSYAMAMSTCREWLVQFAPDVPLKRLRGPIIAFAQSARGNEVPPEKMIADLKAVLFRLAQFETRRAAERGEMMHQLVTVAINAYYGRTHD
jgi:hypothetical protein